MAFPTNDPLRWMNCATAEGHAERKATRRIAFRPKGQASVEPPTPMTRSAPAEERLPLDIRAPGPGRGVLMQHKPALNLRHSRT